MTTAGLSHPSKSRTGPPETASKQVELNRILQKLERVLVCFSGGIDSTYLLWSALNALGPKNTLAVTAVSPSLAKKEKEEIGFLLERVPAPHQWIDTNEFDNPDYIANTANRCFFCKDELFTKASAIAQEKNMTVVDGFNYSDRDDFRPGYQAAKKWGVAHPLEEALLTKSEIRELAEQAGLPNWEKPATPCLSSRIPHGQMVTVAALEKVEAAEDYLKKLGFSILRVRHIDKETAKIELSRQDFARATAQDQAIRTHFNSLGFKNIYLDLTPRTS